jgi:hypothetical protein
LSAGSVKLGHQRGREANNNDRMLRRTGKALLPEARTGGRARGVVGRVFVGEDGLPGSKNRPTQAGDRLSGTSDIK